MSKPDITIDTIENQDNSFLNKKLDKITQDIVPQENEVIGNSNNDQTILNDEILEKTKIAEEQEEEVLYANLFPKKIPKPKDPPTYKDQTHGKTIKEAQEKQAEILSTKVPDNKMFVIEEGTGNIIFKQFNEAELKIIEETMTDLQMGKLKIKKGSLQTTLRELDHPNLFKDTATFQDFVATIFKDNIEVAKRGKMSMDEIAAAAAKYGRNDVYMKILKRKEGEPFNAEFAYRAIVEVSIARAEVDRLANIVMSDKATAADVELFYRTFALYGSLFSQTAGALSETGRTLGIVSKMDVPKSEGVDELGKILEAMNVDPNDVTAAQRIAQAYLQLEPHQKSKFAKDGIVTKLRDAWAEVWINTRLASPITHTVNIAGNITFNTLRIAEYGIAAGLNKIPGLSSADGVMFNEVFAMIKSFRYGSKLAIGNAYSAFKSGESVTNKLDLRKDKAISKTLAGKYQDTALGHFFEYVAGPMIRFPGRLLVAEDEMMKGFIFQMELERIATSKMNKYVQDFPGDIKGAENVYKQTLADPDSATVKEIQESMLEGTFQKDLPPGIFSNLQSILNVPEMKMFVPFYKTIMNIFFESNKRNPALAWLSKDVRKNISGGNGKKAQQLAIAKLTAGATLMYQFGSMAYGANVADQGTMITGMMPTRKAEREAFMRKGLQPYSICVAGEDGLYECTSYARFDPVSSLLAISADFAYMSSRPGQYEDPNFVNDMESLFKAGLASIFPYIMQQPFAQGVTELGAIFQPGYGDPENMATRSLTNILEKLTEVTAGIAINPLGTFGNYLTKHSDPKIYDTMITTDQASWWRENFDGDIPAPIRAFYKQFNKAMHQSPFYNPELEVRVNLWGEEMQGPEMNVFSPIRVSKEKYNRVDDWLVKLGLGIPMPKAFIGGIPLTSEEYKGIIKYMNSDIDGDGTMLDEMLDLIDNDDDWEEMLPGDKLQALKDIVSNRKQLAIENFLADNPTFNDKVELLKERVNRKGKR